MTAERQFDTPFEKKDTQIAKGIAILAMLFHHTIPNVCHLPIFLIDGVTVLSVLAAAGKICVSLLTILSGYGLAQVYSKKVPVCTKQRTFIYDLKFVSAHLVQLISLYWPINAAAAVLVFIKEIATSHHIARAEDISNLLLGLLGLHRYAGDWYLLAIVIMYLLFPILYRLVDRYRVGFLMVIWLPWLLYFIKLFIPIGLKLDSAMLYLFAFSLGIYLSTEDKLRKRSDREWKYYVFFAVCFIMRIVFSLPFDVFLSLSILMLLTRTHAFSGKNTQVVLKAMGIESATIWLIHPFVLAILKHFITTGTWYSYLIIFVLLAGMSLFSAKIISFIKDKIGYQTCIKKLRAKMEG